MYSRTKLRFWMLLLVLLAACTLEGSASVDDGPTDVVTISETDDAVIGTGVTGADENKQDSADEFPEPPAAFLTVDGVTQESGIGTYCWGSGAGPGICADKLGIPTSVTALEASPLALMRFEFLVGQVPNRATLTVRPVTEK